MKTVFIKGSNGFVGSHLISTLAACEWKVRVAVRRSVDNSSIITNDLLKRIIVKDFNSYS